MAALALVAPSLANAETQTTVYTYNADGALTSITEMSDGGSKTTYFTWDNFEADPNTPSTGTVTAANGNLIGIGTTPGDDSVSSWHHDVLDRLVRVTNWQGDKALYQYHPDELLAASLNADAPSTDGLQHYYDESRYPQVTNLYDRHTGELSSRHHQIRYLEDGTEQMLVRHRKDVDGVYELTGQTMSGYGYDPYGASLARELTGSPPAGPLYSVRNNPYRYTHELQDPVSGAYYLRARWYLPGHQTFLQRDPVANLNRYGYANGNPITNYDPGGRSAKRFFKGLEHGFFGTFASGFGIVPLVTTGKDSGRAAWGHWQFDLQLIQFVGLVAGAAFSMGAGIAATSAAMRWATRLAGVSVAFNYAALGSGTALGANAAIQAIHEKRLDSFLGGTLGGFAGMGLTEYGATASAVSVGSVAVEARRYSAGFGPRSLRDLRSLYANLAPRLMISILASKEAYEVDFGQNPEEALEAAFKMAKNEAVSGATRIRDEMTRKAQFGRPRLLGDKRTYADARLQTLALKRSVERAIATGPTLEWQDDGATAIVSWPEFGLQRRFRGPQLILDQLRNRQSERLSTMNEVSETKLSDDLF